MSVAILVASTQAGLVPGPAYAPAAYAAPALAHTAIAAPAYAAPAYAAPAYAAPAYAAPAYAPALVKAPAIVKAAPAVDYVVSQKAPFFSNRKLSSSYKINLTQVIKSVRHNKISSIKLSSKTQASLSL